MSRARLRALRAMRSPKNYGESETADLDIKLSKSLDPDRFSESDEPDHEASRIADEYMNSSGSRRAMRDLDSGVARSADRLREPHNSRTGDAYGEAETDDLDKKLKKALSPGRLAVK